MQNDQLIALLNEAMSLNATMGKIAEPCFKCLWSEKTPACDESHWHKHDDINKKLAAAIDLLNNKNNDNV